METYHITGVNLTDGVYNRRSNFDAIFDGHLEIAENLGAVTFLKSLIVKGRITSGNYSGIKAGGGISSRLGIRVGHGIQAGEGIESGWEIIATEAIVAGWGIRAGFGIESGGGIRAGFGIESGGGIRSGGGIVAGEGIKVKYNIFVGTTISRFPSKKEMEIRCKKLVGGTIKHGNLVLTKKKNENPKTIFINNAKYKLIED